MTYTVCNAVTHPVSHEVTHCVQNQNQTQIVVLPLVVVGGSDQIQSDRHLGPLAAPIGFGARA